MNVFSAIFLGLIQGLTEFLPISSSAHVQIAQQLIGLDRNMTAPELTAFIATIQLGTEAAVLIYFWKDILRIAGAFLGSLLNRGKANAEKTRDAKLGWLIILGSIPVVVVGLLFKNVIEKDIKSKISQSLIQGET